MRTMSSAWESSLAKIRVLGTSVRPGKASRQNLVAELLDDSADLAFRDNVAVELVGGVGHVLVSSSSRSARVSLWRLST